MSAVIQGLWDRALEILREEVGEDEFQIWLAPIAFEHLDEEAQRVVLSVSSDFYQRWISRKYMDPILSACQQATGRSLNVELVVSAPPEGVEESAAGSGGAAADRGWKRLAGPGRIAPEAPRTQRVSPPVAPQQVPAGDRPRLNQRYTFEDFVVGESNRYAHAAAQAVSDPFSQAFNPLFIYGPSGLGKTHLMQAIGHEFLRRKPDAHILYVSSEQFTNGFIEAIQMRRSLEFRNQYRNVDLLLLDDVQFLMGKESTQHEVFHTFNALFDSGKKIVLTSDRQPKDLSTLEDRLRSRFEWGVIADIQPPDLEQRAAILRHKASLEDMKLPSDVVNYIAEWVRSNIRELEGALKRIKVYASLHNCPVNMEVCREVLSHLVIGQPQNRITVEDIQRAVCEYFEISLEQLMGRNRSKKFSQPRHLALYLSRELTDLSFPDIAQKFGGKDHTSVIYACRKIRTAADEDPNMQSIINYLTKQIQKGQTT